jgi:predicted DNA-binding transcriptional regulator YafY
MDRPTTRVLVLLELLQTYNRISGPELARRLEVDTRTLRRYVQILQDIGVPVEATRGRHGAYQLGSGYKLPPMMFNNDEVQAIALGLLAAGQLGLEDAALMSARVKLDRALPAALKLRARAIAEVVQIEAHKTPPPASSPHFAVLASGAYAKQQIALRYRSGANAGHTRVVDPYALAFFDNHWYTVGYCNRSNALRSFRLDRIDDAQLLTSTFARPEPFDAIGHLLDGLAALPRKLAVEVIVHAPPERVRATLPRPLGFVEPIDGQPDRARLRGRTDDAQWYAQELAHAPFAFTIVEPDALRDAVRALAARLTTAAATRSAAS